jgi:hypothetical protein
MLPQLPDRSAGAQGCQHCLAERVRLNGNVAADLGDRQRVYAEGSGNIAACYCAPVSAHPSIPSSRSFSLVLKLIQAVDITLLSD